MELFSYRVFSNQEIDLNPELKNFCGGLKFCKNNFIGPVIAGSLEQVIINPEARKSIQIYFSK